MPERVITCGECGAQGTLPDGDWDSLQSNALEDWKAHHSQEVHDGNDLKAISLEPEPAEG